MKPIQFECGSIMIILHSNSVAYVWSMYFYSNLNSMNVSTIARGKTNQRNAANAHHFYSSLKNPREKRDSINRTAHNSPWKCRGRERERRELISNDKCANLNGKTFRPIYLPF